MDKKILIIGGLLLVFFMVMIAPVIEITAWKNNQIIMHSFTRMISPGSQSLIPVGSEVDNADKVDVKIITSQTTKYYLCEDVTPKTYADIIAECSYEGSN